MFLFQTNFLQLQAQEIVNSGNNHYQITLLSVKETGLDTLPE